MTTLHIENQINDFAEWKARFDRYEQFRVDNGMLGYRITTPVDDPSTVYVDMDFPTREAAEEFRAKLAKILVTPASAEVSVAHTEPQLRDVRAAQVLTPTA